MSNEKKQIYLDLYSKYIERAVNLHNYHRQFIVKGAYDAGLGVRKNLRAMRALEKEMILACRAAWLEAKETEEGRIRSEKARLLAEKKANKRPVGRPKGTKNVNNK
jgi:hypothetical protein